MKTMFKCENGSLFCPNDIVCVHSNDCGECNDGRSYRWRVLFGNRVSHPLWITQVDYERFVKWVEGEGSQIGEMFKCENGDILSLDKIVFTYHFNIRPTSDDRFIERLQQPWIVLFDDNVEVYIFQADHERLLKVLEEKGMVK